MGLDMIVKLPLQDMLITEYGQRVSLRNYMKNQRCTSEGGLGV